jgi:hypothetical protein
LSATESSYNNTKVEYTYFIDSHGNKVKHGNYTILYANGKTFLRGEFYKGEYHGRFVAYGKNNEVLYDGIYKKGRPWDGSCFMGYWIGNYKDGVLISRRE